MEEIRAKIEEFLDNDISIQSREIDAFLDDILDEILDKEIDGYEADELLKNLTKSLDSRVKQSEFNNLFKGDLEIKDDDYKTMLKISYIYIGMRKVMQKKNLDIFLDKILGSDNTSIDTKYKLIYDIYDDLKSDAQNEYYEACLKHVLNGKQPEVDMVYIRSILDYHKNDEELQGEYIDKFFYYLDSVANLKKEDKEKIIKGVYTSVSMGEKNLERYFTNIINMQGIENEEKMKMIGQLCITTNNNKYERAKMIELAFKCVGSEDKQKDIMRAISEMMNNRLDKDLPYIDITKNEATTSALLKFTKTYADFYIPSDSQSIVRNEWIDYLGQLYKTDRLSEEHKKEFEAILQKIGAKSGRNDLNIEQYDGKVESFQDMEPEEFNRFLRDLISVREKEGIIPEKYCDYLLLRKMYDNEPNSPKATDSITSLMIKRAYQDKARHVLSEKGMNDYIVRLKKTNPNILGSHIEATETIAYNPDKIGTPDSISTLYHEIRHAEQSKKMREGNVDDSMFYLMIKEEVIMDYDAQFYDTNYKYMYAEIDARIEGKKKEYEYLQKVYSIAEIVGFDREDILETIRSISGKVQSELTEEGGVFNAASEKKTDYRIEPVDHIFQRILVQNDPSHILQEYPVLQAEFEPDGTRKGNMAILREYDRACLQGDSSQQSLYESILKNNSKIGEDQVMEDIEQLVQYEPENGKAQSYRDIIIINEIERQMETWKMYAGIEFEGYTPTFYQRKKAQKYEEATKKMDQFYSESPLEGEEIDDDFLNALIEFENSRASTTSNQDALDEINALKKIDSEVTAKELHSGYMALSRMSEKSAKEEKDEHRGSSRI